MSWANPASRQRNHTVGWEHVIVGAGGEPATLGQPVPAHAHSRGIRRGWRPTGPSQAGGEDPEGGLCGHGGAPPRVLDGPEIRRHREERRETAKMPQSHRHQHVGAVLRLICIRESPPQLIPELVAYMSTIVWVTQDFSSLAWVRYDTAFRRQAAMTGNTKWSVLNSTLYTMCFTGLAAARSRCELCFASTHTENECTQREDPELNTRERLKAMTGKSSKPAATPAPPQGKCSGSGTRVAAHSPSAATSTLAAAAGETTRRRGVRTRGFGTLMAQPRPGLPYTGPPASQGGRC